MVDGSVKVHGGIGYSELLIESASQDVGVFISGVFALRGACACRACQSEASRVDGRWRGTISAKIQGGATGAKVASAGKGFFEIERVLTRRA